jgi:diguanylate cyclase (GGDEF)-like protein
MVAEARTSVDETLELACDLCIGLGAFVVTLTGTVHGLMCDPVQPDDAARRIELLARSSLAHPAAHGRQLFWNAEVSTEAESAEHLLGCVVAPVWAGDTQSGLLGVVDTWLPEPDDDQRAGLAALAGDLAVLLPHPGASGPGVPPSRPVPTVRLAEGSGTGPGLEPFLMTVLDHVPDPLVVVRADGAIVLVNRAFAEMVGMPEDDLLGRDVGGVVSSETGTGPDGALAHAVDQTAPGGRLMVATPGGQVAVDAGGARISSPFAGDCTLVVMRPARSAADTGAVVAVTDLIQSLDTGIMCLDASGTVVLANRAADALHGLPPHRSLVGSQLPMATALRTEDGQVVAHDHHPGLRVLRDGAPYDAHLTLGEDGAGQRHVAVSARPFMLGGHPGAIVMLHDATAAWLEQQRLTHYALHDPLTNLANRYLLLEELRRMLQGLGRRGGSVALVYLDLDDFKHINDEHGHDVGDEVLAAVARRLKGAVRGDDVVSRLGGDEFVIAHASSERVPDGDLVVSRIRKVLSAPFRLRGEAFDVGASIGWVSTDTDDVGPDALLAQADRAMYRHKRDRSLLRRGAA